jgi:hypothetical protein
VPRRSAQNFCFLANTASVTSHDVTLGDASVEVAFKRIADGVMIAKSPYFKMLKINESEIK